jgi:probable rRNA maturation factor
MILLDNTTDHPVAIKPLQVIADTQTQRDIELIICDDTAIAALNHEHRNVGHATDVLSFPLEGEHDHLPLGAVVISYDHALRKSRDLGHSPEEELTLLFVHGLLHLLGYDHENDSGQMREKEHAILRQFGLPESLIIRTERS